jgi:hypothetical protein
MRPKLRILSISAVSLLMATLIPHQAARAAEPWLEEDFQGGATGTFGASGISTTSQGHQGDGIRVDIPAGEHWGTTTHWNTSRIGQEPEEMWLRYWIKFPNGFRVDEPYRGKLPGFGGLYTYNCLGGRPSTSGAPCWSARLAFSPLYPGDGLPSSPVDPSTVTRISFYAYLLNSSDVGQTGQILHWDPDRATLRHDRWYCVEARVKVNSLGKRNGILEGYVDGSRAFQATNLNFRRASEGHVKVKSLWFDVYYGGEGTSPKNNQIFFDSVAAGPERVGCNDNPASSGTFFDDDSSVFENDIERLAASGITVGCNPPENNRFCPDDPVTRGQMAAFMRRALADSFQVDLPDAPGSPPDFWGARTDVEYKAALDLYASGGAPLDTYVVTHSIDDTGSTRDWMSPEGPSHWAPMQLEQIWERGATPYVRVEVDDLSGLVSGNHDTRIRRMFQTFASFTDQGGGRRIILDVLPESNNDHLSYGDDPSRFKAAFGRVVEAARSELGNRVRTVFSALPRMDSNRHSHATWGAGGYKLFWPGRSLVDVAGISGYDDRAGTNISLYQSAISEMASVTGPGTPLMISLGGAPNRPSEAAQIDYVGSLADFAAEHGQMVGIQWEDRKRGEADMRVSTTSGLQSGFATASAPARADGVDWLFSSATNDWIAMRRAYIPFDDATSSVFVSDIRWLAATGITKGCASRMFCPNDHVTRGQMAAFLSRALGLASPSRPIVFDDTGGHTFTNDISKLAHAGITLGCNPPDNDRFCPDDDVTRGQMAAFMVRAGLTD